MLLEHLGLAKKQHSLGAYSERFREGLMDQLSLFMANKAENYAYGTRNATAEQVAVKAHARKRQSGNVLEGTSQCRPPSHCLCAEMEAFLRR